MRRPHHAIAILAVLSLTACVRLHPIDLTDDNPANPKAPSGFVDTPTALAHYRSSDDFAERASAEAKSPSGGSMMDMHDMPGMDHGNMPGMQHGGAPHGAAGQ